MHELHLQRSELAVGQRREQTDRRPRQHFREVTGDVGRPPHHQHGLAVSSFQAGGQGVGKQPCITQRMAQAIAKGGTGEKQIFEQQAVIGRQVRHQMQAHMLFATGFRAGLPEGCLGTVGKPPLWQALRGQTQLGQNRSRIDTTGTQGLDHRAQQRRVIGQISHRHFWFFL